MTTDISNLECKTEFLPGCKTKNNQYKVSGWFKDLIFNSSAKDFSF